MSVSDGICWMDGLADIMYGEVVEFECGETGMVLDIQQDRIGCVIFGEYEHIDSGSPVRRVGRIASVPVGDGMLGRIVDSVGNPIDGIGPDDVKINLLLERIKNDNIKEVIIAVKPSIEGETTSLYILNTDMKY